MIFWHLFLTFLKVGFVSFGGGYAVIPLIQYKVEQEEWMSGQQLQEAVSLAGMAPGPIATNTATLIGYQTYGIGGAIASTLGIVLPSLIVIIILAGVFYKLQRSKGLKASFYGLRPVILGLMAYAAIHFMMSGKTVQALDWTSVITVLLCGAAVYAILKYKLHPVLIIVLSGIAGIVLF
ncbi:chromate transporter [Paenibacillus sp. FJAT-27812]|uniref:chromate transporter n=1 Tax=Bacillales TaxID=1385 RepID=UPI000A6916C1